MGQLSTFKVVTMLVLGFYCSAILADSFQVVIAKSDKSVPLDDEAGHVQYLQESWRPMLAELTGDALTGDAYSGTNAIVVAEMERGITLKTKEEIATHQARHALIIGNSNYINSPLKNPANDAEDMADALQKLGFSVTLVLDGLQTDMETAVNSFTKILTREGGTGIFYYAGHSMQIAGRNYLIPVDSDIKDETQIKYKALDVGKVLDGMELANNKVNILILDACRNNPFTRSYRSANQGLAHMDAPIGTFIAYATAPGKVAIDGEGRNGVFTRHLLHHMSIAGLSLEDTFKRVRIGVMNATNRKQTPWDSSSLTDDFYFIENNQHEKIPYSAPPVQIYVGEQASKKTGSLTVDIPDFDFETPWYKRWYVWVGVVAIAALALTAGGSGGDGGDGGGMNGGAGGNGG